MTSDGSANILAFGQSATTRGVRESSAAGGYRVFYRIVPDTGPDDSAGDVRVLRVYGPGQDRRML